MARTEALQLLRLTHGTFCTDITRRAMRLPVGRSVCAPLQRVCLEASRRRRAPRKQLRRRLRLRLHDARKG
eukprot:6182512-Pleurochrysis_carterae.AAC.2